jgi:hypothetical protein
MRAMMVLYTHMRFCWVSVLLRVVKESSLQLSGALMMPNLYVMPDLYSGSPCQRLNVCTVPLEAQL